MRQPAATWEPTHSDLRRTVCRYLDIQGAYYLPILGGLGTRSGSPDILCCLRGRFVAIELKVKRDKLRPKQVEQRRLIEQAGGLWIQARRLEDVQDALEADGLTLIGRLT